MPRLGLSRIGPRSSAIDHAKTRLSYGDPLLFHRVPAGSLHCLGCRLPDDRKPLADDVTT